MDLVKRLEKMLFTGTLLCFLIEAGAFVQKKESLTYYAGFSCVALGIPAIYLNEKNRRI